MEAAKFLRHLFPILILGIFILQPANVRAYGVETHAFLTGAAVDLYNQQFPERTIHEDLKAYLIDGSRREDNAPRFMNHFYDPIYERGLTFDPWAGVFNLGNWKAANEWVVDRVSQNSTTYDDGIFEVASSLSTLQKQTLGGVRYQTDFTWQRALQWYVDGEEEKAFYALGHVIHLIEDVSVPDHTRNDPHPPPSGSPYEKWTSSFAPENPDKELIKKLEKTSVIALSDLPTYFYELATYSNKGFYSKHSIGIQSRYENPMPDYFRLGSDGKSYGMKIDREFGDYYLIKTPVKLIQINFDREEFLKGNLIFPDYWARLSTKAVQYGAGVINLFFEEAEKAKNDPNYLAQQYGTYEPKPSFARRIVGGIGNMFSSIGSGIAGLFGSDQDSQGFELVEEIAIADRTVVTTETDNTPIVSDAGAQLQQSVVPAVPQKPQQEITTDALPQTPEQVQQTQATTTEVGEENNTVEIKEEQQVEERTQSAEEVTRPQLPQQCSFATNQSPSHQGALLNEIAWMGGSSSFGLTANDEFIELKNVSGNPIDISGWQIIDSGEQIHATIDQNTTFAANGFYLLERTDDSSVPGVTADATYTGALGNSDEALRLFNKECVLVDEVRASPDWPAGDNGQKRTMERASDLSWHTYNGIVQGNVYGTPKRENSSAVTSSGGGGGGSPTTNTQQTNANQQQPAGNNENEDGQNESEFLATATILLSEIQAGTDNGSDDEFVELYNPNDQQVNLSGWSLKKQTSGGTEQNLVSAANVSGIIPAYGFFLIASNAYQGIAAPDLFYSNNSNPLAYASNTVALYDGNGALIDEVAWSEIIKNESLERNAISNDACVSAKGSGEFLGNACDTDGGNDWEMREIPQPQNSTNLPEPRGAPQAVQSFNVVYSSSTKELNLTWDITTSTAPFTYTVSDVSDASSTMVLAQNTVSSSLTKAIGDHETGREYVFSIVAVDKEELQSTSTRAAIVIPPSTPPGAQHIVISEVLFDAEGSDKGKEFIELYNPTAQPVDITAWSLKLQEANATSTETIARFRAVTEDKTRIPALGFFLVGFNGYSTSTGADIARKTALPNGSSIITLTDTLGVEVDKVEYEGTGNEEVSFERMAWDGEQCISATGRSEFSGNACDTNQANDWEVRTVPRPQNTASLPESRSAPTDIEHFEITYDANAMALALAWERSQDATGATSSIVYELKEYNSPGTVIAKTTAPGFEKGIHEIGRDYMFSVQAFDRDGMESTVATATITVPSLINNLYFYQHPVTGEYVAELQYDNYPFIPNKYQRDAWKVVMFYFNTDAQPRSIPALYSKPDDLSGTIQVRYKTCAGADRGHQSLVLADSGAWCGVQGGAFNYSFLGGATSLSVMPQIESATSTDFIALAFYATTHFYPQDGRIPYFGITAVDKTRYYFGTLPPELEIPVATSILSVASSTPPAAPTSTPPTSSATPPAASSTPPVSTSTPTSTPPLLE